MLTLPERERKNPALRRELLNSCDVAILCLPEDAAIEACNMVIEPHVRIIDPSTAHRISKGWVYGLPEAWDGGWEQLDGAKRVSVPGCHASGFLALTAPLIAAGILKKDALLSCTSLTGYSGGGHKMIAQYESDYRDVLLKSPRLYALGQQHKHLKEMQHYSGLITRPAFFPVVADYFNGMLTILSVFREQLTGRATASRISATSTARDTRGPWCAIARRWTSTGISPAAS